MKKLTVLIVLAMLLVSVTAALALAGSPSAQGVQPKEYPGNFVSSDDDQVCYDMSALNYIGEVTGEMRGFKIDPPVNYSDGNVSTTISTDGKYLNWSSTNANVLAFIIKGGSSYNLYDYVGTGLMADQSLHSPITIKGKTTTMPQISHYNVCYEVPDGTQGCTPGYWRNHADRWLGAAPSDDFDATFGVDLFSPNITLGMAINNPQTYGTFAFHAVAALLNSTGGVPNADGTTVDYPFSTTEVIQKVQAAVAEGGDIEGTKNDFAEANELGCPLGGTKADKVP